MFNQLNSILKPISYGIVAEDKKEDSDMIEVWPVEIVPSLIDDVDNATLKRKSNGLNSDLQNSPYAVEVKMSLGVPAKWIGSTNRALSPDVVKGESVCLYQMGDSDVYLWDSLGRTDGLRRLERVTYAFSADPNNPLDQDNRTSKDCYLFTVDSYDKHITLSTSKANGEPTAYTFQFNTGEGQWTLEDDIGNHLHLNSTEHVIEFVNADESHVKIDKEHIDCYSKDTMRWETTTWDIKAETINVEATTINYTATDINTKAKTITTKANNINITAETSHKGNVSVTGNQSVSGNVSVGGGLSVGAGGGAAAASGFFASASSGGSNTINNGLTVDGDLEVSGNVDAPNVNCSTINDIPIALYLKDT